MLFDLAESTFNHGLIGKRCEKQYSEGAERRESLMKTLGYRLAEARKNFGLTQKQVAEKLYLTTQAISSWESGNSVPDTEKIPEII